MVRPTYQVARKKRCPSLSLTAEQMRLAEFVASQLHDRLRKQGVPNGHGLRDSDATRDMETGGSASELAASLLLGVPWTAAGGVDKEGADIGVRTQVRSSNKPRETHSLIVRKKDIAKYGNVPFLLVVQQGTRFELRGWIMSHDAMRIGRWWDGGDGGRPPAWFVHESLLRPITELKDV